MVYCVRAGIKGEVYISWALIGYTIPFPVSTNQREMARKQHGKHLDNATRFSRWGIQEAGEHCRHCDRGSCKLNACLTQPFTPWWMVVTCDQLFSLAIHWSWWMSLGSVLWQIYLKCTMETYGPCLAAEMQRIVASSASPFCLAWNGLIVCCFEDPRLWRPSTFWALCILLSVCLAFLI